MKRKLLRALYNLYRTEFYTFFAQEFIEEIPRSIHEPTMGFLANGKDKITRWCLFMASTLQKKIATTPKEIEFNTGMLVMLKLFMSIVNNQRPIQTEEIGEPETSHVDHAARVGPVVEALREVFKNK